MGRQLGTILSPPLSSERLVLSGCRYCDCPLQGSHVARLAADLRDLLTQLDLSEVTVVGSSMGCAVIWSYIYLFGEERLAQVRAVPPCRQCLWTALPCTT